MDPQPNRMSHVVYCVRRARRANIAAGARYAHHHRPHGTSRGRERSMTYSDDTPVPNYLARLRLDGRPFAVLGAGQGIGRQTTHALSQAGASVLCVDNDERRASEIAEEVGGVACVADIRDREHVERVISEAIAAFGSLHGIVDSVGAARYAKFLATTDADWEWTFDIVLRHAFLVAQIGGRAL